MRKSFGSLALCLVLVALAAPAVLPSRVLAAEAIVRAEDDQQWVRFSGAWNYKWKPSYSAESARLSDAAGAASKVSFDGTGISWVSELGPNRGKARVFLDGTQRAVVDLYAAEALGGQSVWSIDGLTEGRHILRIVVVGSSAAASTGDWVAVDAFDVRGRVAAVGPPRGVRIEQGDSRLYRKGTWYRSARSGPYGNSSMRSSTGGRSVSLRFRGTAVAWLGVKDVEGGFADVYLDGDRVATVSQGRAGSADERRVCWAVTGLPAGEHTVRIKVAGPSATGASAKVDVDAFQVSGAVLQATRPTPLGYPWKTYIVIDKSDFRLYWVRNGMLVKTYPVALGRVGMTTPSRVWRIGIKYHTSPGSVYGPRKMRLFKRVSPSGYAFTAYGIHGTNQEWVIGTRASHGCIRMYNRDILELFPQVPVGTMVVTRD